MDMIPISRLYECFFAGLILFLAFIVADLFLLSRLEVEKQGLDKLSYLDPVTGGLNRMVDIGVRSGSLDEVMKNISELYEEEIDGRISRMLSILEPTLVIVLSVIVGVILLSVMPSSGLTLSVPEDVLVVEELSLSVAISTVT